MQFRTRAPAKINLTLHVLRRRLDGYHDLESLVAFAGVADIVELLPNEPLGLDVSGPTAGQAGDLDDNLVLRAARALSERVPGLVVGRFRLIKRLPVGAGIGGGSSDAAAALRLLAELNTISLFDERLQEAALVTGADVPVCMHPRAKMMRGTGDQLSARLSLPPLSAVLVNPGVHLDTKIVFGRMGMAPGQDGTNGEHPPIHDELDGASFLAAVGHGRNDMESSAKELAPVIGDVLAALRRMPECRLARMSGSGSSCFGLFSTRALARRAAMGLRQDHPRWWVRATPLG